MRFTPVALVLALAAATFAASGHGQRGANPVDPASAALVEQARASHAAGRHDQAIDLLETALAVEPANGGAFVLLGRVALSQRLPGKAIRLFGEALEIAPNDIGALHGQGEAFVQRGALERARANLARLRSLCRASCPQVSSLSASIQRGPPAEALAAQRPDAAPPQVPVRQPN